MRRHELRALARAVLAALDEDWAPLGGGVPGDEYDAFVWPLVGLLRDGATGERLTAYLRDVAEPALGAAIADQQRQVAVDRLLGLIAPGG